MTNKSILLIDDCLQNLKLTKFLLRREGFEVGIAENADQALRSLEERIPDMILMDIQLPGMNGLETLRALNGEYLRHHPEEVAAFLNERSPEDTALLLARAPTPTAAAQILERLNPRVAADVLALLDDVLVRAILAVANPVKAAPIIGGLDPVARDAQLARLDERVAQQIRELLAYPADSAGALMDPRISAFGPDTTVEGALRKMRTFKEKELGSIYLMDKDGRLDLDQMAQAARWAGLVFLCNPNNPTSTAVRLEEIAELLDAVPRHVCVIVDEAYCEFNVLGHPDASLDLLDAHPNLVLLRTFSKVHGLCGLRVGFALSGAEEFRLAVDRVRQPFFCNAAAQAAAIEAAKKFGPQRLSGANAAPTHGLQDGPDTAGDHRQRHDGLNLGEVAAELGHKHDRQDERARHQKYVLDRQQRQRGPRRHIVDAVDQPGGFLSHARFSSTFIQIGVARKKSEPTTRVSPPAATLRT